MVGKRVGLIGCRVGKVHAAACALLLSFCLASPSYASQACCDDSNDGFECFDDDIGSGTVCVANGLGEGTSCQADCGCGETCPNVVEPTKGNGSITRITFLGTSPDGPDTKYSYSLCKLAGADLSHFVLGITDCCDNIVSTSGPAGTAPGTSCGTDPSTGLFGLKFDETSPLTDCASGSDLYTITVSGTPINVCTKVATKADGLEDTASACIPGPFCDCATRGSVSVCGDEICQPPCEDCNTCPQDCNTCGDGCCIAPETKCDCPDDCGAPDCGDGVCECDEDCNNCEADCGCNPCRKFCRADGVCATTCGDGFCDLECENCSKCEADCACPACTVCDPDIPACVTTCGDGVCDEACEDCNTCPSDCSPTCGDGVCECGEDANNCCTDCGCTDPCTTCNTATVTCDPVVCTNMLDQCNNATCDPATGLCTIPVPKPLSTECEDGNLCQADHCDGAGNCVPNGPPVICTNMLDQCNNAACDPATGQCTVPDPKPLSTDCEAETPPNLCTPDHCDGAGNCVPNGPPVDCTNMLDQCNNATCDAATGLCTVPDPKPESTVCEADGEVCTSDHCDGNGNCVFLAPNFVCGDGTCECDETMANCCTDCGCPACETCVGNVCVPDCGNGTCQPECNEDCVTCPSDCGCPNCETCNTGTGQCDPDCGNGVCQPECGEDCDSCPADCGCPPCTHCEEICTVGRSCRFECVSDCGDGVCDPACENCATCDDDCACEFCTTCNTATGACDPDCGDGVCDPLCGENCRTCAGDCSCDPCDRCSVGGTCQSACGDGTCDPNCETCSSCPQDCHECGDGCCTASAGEDCCTCSQDCGPCCGNGVCDGLCGENCSTCPDDCEPPEGEECMPTVSEWGMIALVLLLLSGLAIKFGQYRRRTQ